MSPVRDVERPEKGGRNGSNGTASRGGGRCRSGHVYTPGDSARLLLNGAEVPGGPTAPVRAKATFTIPYAPGELTAVASRDGAEIGRTALTTVGVAAGLRLTADVHRLTTGRDDLAHVLVEVVDGHGRVVPDAGHEVSFRVGGAGTLAAVGNGNPHNADSFRPQRRHTLARQGPRDPLPGETAGRPHPHRESRRPAPGAARAPRHPRTAGIFVINAARAPASRRSAGRTVRFAAT
ncbi:MAG TPA: DUF4982 domain-containing protein [Streptosporangiaceae bacterium]